MSRQRGGPSFACMGIAEDIAGDGGWDAALAALGWQVDLGANEAIGDAPVNRYDIAALNGSAPAVVQQPLAATQAAGPADAVTAAKDAARRAKTLVQLREALVGFQHCEVKLGARNLVFAEGFVGAQVLVLGPAPGREEDQEGRPFAGPAGLLLDRMFAAIGLARDGTEPATGLYLTGVMPWRPRLDREPDQAELAMMRPFVERHIALAAPKIVVVMGNSACGMLLAGSRVSQMRGIWAEALGLPVLPMFDPAHLIRNPASKREAWADMLALQARLRRIT